MQEALVITTKQSILDIVEQLRTLTAARIEVENDFTKGLKAIFYRIPGVVFLQGEITGITAEKVANQVKTLLEGESIRLVLLRDDISTWDAGDLSFDGVIDLSLPSDEVVGLFLQQINSSPDHGNESSAGEQPPQADSQIIELTVESSQPEGEVNFDPFSDTFPAHFHHDWGTLPPEADLEMQNHPGPAGLSGKSSGPDDEFCFDPPGDIISMFPPEKTIATSPKTKESQQGTSSATVPVPVAEEGPVIEDIRLTDKESPHQLFASMNDEAPVETPFQTSGSDAAPPPLENRLRLKGIQTHSSILKTSSPEIAPVSETYGKAKTSPGISGDAAARRTTTQPVSTRAVVGKTSAKSGTKPEPLNRLSSGGDLHAGATFRDDNSRGTSLTHKLIYVLLLLAICLATFLLVMHWDDLSGFLFKEKKPAGITKAPPPTATEKLPAFIPAGVPDSAYTIAHPGWERYEAAGLEYLVYRENGRIRAIQVIAGAEGKISDSYLRMCIRGATGLDDGSNWVRVQQDDFRVEKGTLPNKGEVVVYRKMPEGEIRGFVLTLH